MRSCARASSRSRFGPPPHWATSRPPRRQRLINAGEKHVMILDPMKRRRAENGIEDTCKRQVPRAFTAHVRGAPGVSPLRRRAASSHDAARPVPQRPASASSLNDRGPRHDPHPWPRPTLPSDGQRHIRDRESVPRASARGASGPAVPRQTAVQTSDGIDRRPNPSGFAHGSRLPTKVSTVVSVQSGWHRWASKQGRSRIQAELAEERYAHDHHRDRSGLAVSELEQATPASQPTARSYRLQDLNWQEAEQVLTPDAVVLIPLGGASVEHGPHLKLRSDQLF